MGATRVTQDSPPAAHAGASPCMLTMLCSTFADSGGIPGVSEPSGAWKVHERCMRDACVFIVHGRGHAVLSQLKSEATIAM